MKKIILFLFSCVLVCNLFAQEGKKGIAIIPEPVSLTKNGGQFVLPKNVVINATTDSTTNAAIELLKNKLNTAAGLKVSVSKVPTAAIHFIRNTTPDKTIGAEGYKLAVTPKNITVRANSGAGFYYAAQTILQLLPKEIESNELIKGVQWSLPCVTVTDYPRFAWRGLMFDVARHFFTKEEVKSYIDQMVRFKYNLLHLHLTDDEGWRIEIKGMPRLTEVGAWNVKKEGNFGTFTPPTPDEPRTYGGFYTQADIKEIVQYAKERFVDVLPEIDVPGHSLAAVVSYPHLSCTPDAVNYRVRSGERIMDWSRGAPPIALVDNTLCPANERVYTFLDTIITQVAALFPFPYLHLGGDEAPYNFWEKNDQISALMQREGLKTMPQVQEYFTRRVEKIVASKGKKMIGWDEILEGGDLPKSTAVMSWRGTKYGIEAAKAGHEVVMSPTTYAYIDYMQADPVIEPRVYATLRLSKAYEFDPLPEGVNPKFIKGGQANLWTEQVYNIRHAQYMTWPRGLAIAESLWSPKEKKNWDSFFNKVEHHFQRFDAAEVKYAPSVYDPIFTVTKGKDSVLKVALSTEVKDLDIYYSFDNTFPDYFYPKYTTAITPPKDAVMLKVITYKGKKPVGRLQMMPIEELQRRVVKPK